MINTILALLSLSAFANETLFKAAALYTVKIKVSILVPLPEDEVGTAHGSGFVVDTELGLIVTNRHVAGNSPGPIEVAFNQEAFIKAERVYVDPFLDIAILRVAKTKGTQATLDCNPHPQVGIAVGTYGFPFFHNLTGTKGVISSLTDRPSIRGGKLLRTDAPINSGNSGGPLIDLDSKKVVGIAMASREKAQNYNVAIAAFQVCPILKLIKNGKSALPPRIPVAFYNQENDQPVLKVAQLREKSNLLQNDVIHAFRCAEQTWNPITEYSELIHYSRGCFEALEFRVERENNMVVFPERWDSMPDPLQERSLLVGGAVISIFPILADVPLTLPRLVISSVIPGSTAENSGISSEDFIETVNDRPVHSLEDVAEILNAEFTAPLRLRILRLDEGWPNVTFWEKSLSNPKWEWVR